MRIAISGVNGLVGSTLKAFFLDRSDEVSEICRHKGTSHSSKIYYDFKENTIDTGALEGHDVIIHLAGANISDQKWTDAYKKEILESRVLSTKLLVKAIKEMNRRPKVFMCASAVGYYGQHDPSIPFHEKSPNGDGFLAKVCQEWEQACAELPLLGLRVIHLRFGMILSKKGGAMAKMLPAFSMGLGGRLGSGEQMMSWIALEEIPRIVDYVMTNDQIRGPVNCVTPHPVTNAEFTKILGEVIHRPTVFSVPGFMVKALYGQMGQELLLEGVRVIPKVLLESGYKFQYGHLKQTLEQVL
ncbi:MAG: TIGR01777 family protein [Candidatus Omnitrophica bacterium]|nr:TIGR01777 family protein [Candidatus Omnitrophota bacterium]